MSICRPLPVVANDHQKWQSQHQLVELQLKQLDKKEEEEDFSSFSPDLKK